MNSIENSQSTGHPQSPGRCSALLAMRSRWKSQRGVRGTQHHLACLPHPYPVHLTHSFLWRWSQAVELEELYFDHDDNDHSMAKITVSGLPKRLWLALSPTGCLFLNFLHDLEVTYVFETQVILFCLFWRWCSVNVLLNNIISWSFYKCPKIIWKLCVCVCARAHARAHLWPTLFATPWTVAFQAPLSMGFPR